MLPNELIIYINTFICKRRFNIEQNIIEALDEYAQLLRNITNQEDVFNIIWPNLDEIDHQHRVRINIEEQLNS